MRAVPLIERDEVRPSSAAVGARAAHGPPPALHPYDRGVLARFVAAGAADNFEWPAAKGELDTRLSAAKRANLLRERRSRNSLAISRLDVAARASMSSNVLGVRCVSSIGSGMAASSSSALTSQYSIQTLDLRGPPTRTSYPFRSAHQSSVEWRRPRMTPPGDALVAGSSARPGSATSAFPLRMLGGRPPRPRTAAYLQRSHLPGLPRLHDLDGAAVMAPPGTPSRSQAGADETLRPSRSKADILESMKRSTEDDSELFLAFIKEKAQQEEPQQTALAEPQHDDSESDRSPQVQVQVHGHQVDRMVMEG
jgi:hypothetical protein